MVDLTLKVIQPLKGGDSKGEAFEDGHTSEGELVQFQRPQRVRQIPRILIDFESLHDTKIDYEGKVIQSAMMVDSEPVNIIETLKKKVWVNTMKKELEAIERNMAQELIVLPQNKKVICVRWVFKINLNPDN